MPRTNKPLSDREALFVREYLVDLNATQAAIRAGYSPKSAAHIGSQLRKKGRVADEIDKEIAARSVRTGITADRVLREAGSILFCHLRDVATWGPGEQMQLRKSDEMSEADAAAIKSVTESEKFVKTVGAPEAGEVLMSRERQIQLHDKGKVLELVMRHLGMLGEGRGDGSAGAGGGKGTDEMPAKAYRQEDWDKLP